MCLQEIWQNRKVARAQRHSPASSAGLSEEVMSWPWVMRFFSLNHIELNTPNLQNKSTQNPNPTSSPLRIVLENSRSDFFCHLPGHTVNLLPLPVFLYFCKKKKKSDKNLRETKMGLCRLSLHLGLFNSVWFGEKKIFASFSWFIKSLNVHHYIN